MKKLLLISLALVITACSPASNTNTTTTNTTNTTSATTQTPAVTETTAATPADTGTPAPAGEGETVGVTYTIPAGWKKDANGTITSPDGGIGVAVLETTDEDPKVVADKLDAVLGALLTDIKVTGDQTTHEVNGISSIYVQGTGKLKEGGKEVEWAAELMQGKKILALLEFFEPGAYEKHQATFDAFENSFDKVDGGGDATGTPDAEATDTPDAEATGTPSE